MGKKSQKNMRDERQNIYFIFVIFTSRVEQRMKFILLTFDRIQYIIVLSLKKSFADKEIKCIVNMYIKKKNKKIFVNK